jgi:hypothetical protein
MSDLENGIEYDEIARRAHEIASGPHASGNDEENWLEAERQLRAELQSIPAKRRTARAVRASKPPAGARSGIE